MPATLGDILHTPVSNGHTHSDSENDRAETVRAHILPGRKPLSVTLLTPWLTRPTFLNTN